MSTSPIDNYFISDPEGYNVDEMYDIPKKPHNLYICGDLIDSTFASPKFNDYLNKKSFNLRNIHKIISNDNINLILGNRDLNKIKCLQLLKMNGNSEIINNFNNGNISFEINVYDQIKNNVSWTINDMTKWYPFWNKKTVKDDLKVNQLWLNSNKIDYKTTPFFNRFKIIFGKDPSDGTMSAQNLLLTIPNELGITSDNNDYKAFIVLSIFRSMILKVDNSIISTNFNSFNKRSSQFCKGWMYKLYKKSKICDYIQIDNINLLLSHGGLTDKFFSYNLDDFNNFITNNDNRNKLVQVPQYEPKVGGYYRNEDIINYLSPEKIKKTIDDWNNLVQKKIDNIYKEEININNEPSNDTLFILMITAPYNDNGIDTKVVSPILPGIKEVRTNTRTTIQRGVNVQIYGHSPNGYSSTIDYINNMYYINLDDSNSFAGTHANVSNYDNNIKNFIKIDKNINIISNARIKFDTEYDYNNMNNNYKKIVDKQDNVEYTTDLFDFINNQTLSEHIIIKSTNITLINKIFELKIENMIDNNTQTILRNIGKNKNICYHGNYINGTTQYFIFTYNATKGFSKVLFVLNNIDFMDFLNKLNKKQKGGQVGGSYYLKYLKYKKKYLQIKNLYI